jgi:hypothetical protein
MMRKALGFVGLVLLAGCSQGGSYHGRQGEAENSAVAADQSAGPSVAPTAAPGVAFNYHYTFRLPAERIIAAQEAHAQACEKIGVARCRITGMNFRRTGDDDIEGQLELKLDPAIARAFGKQGIDIVTRADGLLAEEEIKGEDVGTAIQAASSDEGRYAGELRKIEAQLARPGLGSAERAQLQTEAQHIREVIAGSQATRTEQQQSLARTPMTFDYESGDMAPGFRRSLRQGLANVVGGLEVMLTLAISLLPWAVLALLVWAAVRFVKARTRRTPAPPAS